MTKHKHSNNGLRRPETYLVSFCFVEQRGNNPHLEAGDTLLSERCVYCDAHCSYCLNVKRSLESWHYFWQWRRQQIRLKLDEKVSFSIICIRYTLFTHATESILSLSKFWSKIKLKKGRRRKNKFVSFFYIYYIYYC